jgi:hypothetical protein
MEYEITSAYDFEGSMLKPWELFVFQLMAEVLKHHFRNYFSNAKISSVEALQTEILLCKIFNEVMLVDQASVQPSLQRVWTTDEGIMQVHFSHTSVRWNQWSGIQYWCGKPVSCLPCQFFSSVWDSSLCIRQVVGPLKWYNLLWSGVRS